MKLHFRGWRREVREHEHHVRPVAVNSDRKYVPGDADKSLDWCGELQAFGRIDNLALSGSFLVEFEFEEQELKNWLRQYVIGKPEASVRLLAEMQAEALIEFSRRKQD